MSEPVDKLPKCRMPLSEAIATVRRALDGKGVATAEYRTALAVVLACAERYARLGGE